MAVIRYPGGKSKLALRLVKVIGDYLAEHDVQYREPFFGAGAIGLRLLEKPFVRRVWFNDIDPGIYSLWTAVKSFPEALLREVEAFTPSTEAFYEYKDYLLNLDSGEVEWRYGKNLVDIAFKKLVVHQLSYSGLGTMSGGPLGGVDQKSDYKVDCRWSPKQLRKEINRLNREFRARKEDATITSLSFDDLVQPTADCFIYLDPPYYVKGPQLYQFSFAHDDHVRLASLLRSCNSPWLLSYDDCPEIRELYGFASLREVPLNYTINGATTKKELLISPKKYEFLLEERKNEEYDLFENEV